ncbi:MAG: Chemotaxis protein methyltransferase CheR [Firmicutes bacterium]|nr:Chemotaxis protein methyltransferase CheR [Bacillota bacterium]
MDDYTVFKELVYRKTGIDLSSYKEKQMKRRIESLASRNGYQTLSEYYKGINSDEKLYNEFINYITINVSEFYRNPGQWRVLEEEILPSLMERKRSLKIWSSACSTGEEPYSLVMLLSRYIRLNEIKILATDIDRQAMEKAKTGIYKEKSLQNLPKEFVSKYFRKNNNDFEIIEEVKARVEFGFLDLLRDSFPKGCDLILCRNVLIYFTEEAKQQIYSKFYDALEPGGILFVGSTEQIIMPNRYKLSPVETFFYRKM